ncbi:MAG: MFS transporter [Bacteroidales bacterium]|nr:MFS transporter [Bacteroidales bacterium]
MDKIEKEIEDEAERLASNAQAQTRGFERLWNGNYKRVWSANFMIFFSFMLLTPLFPLYLSDEWGTDRQTIGIVLSGYTLATLLVRPFGGFFVDSFPRKKVLMITFFLFALFFGGYIVAGTLTLFAIVRTLHGLPFGAVTVANSTVAIDVLPSSRRTEGIGYYGLSNNIATAIAPTLALWIYAAANNFQLLFWLSLAIAFGGLWIDSGVRLKDRQQVKNKAPMSLDRFLMLKGWSQGLAMICYAFSYGVLSTYVAIYAKEQLGIMGGTGMFFMLLAGGLILSRLTGSRSLRRGKIVHNASIGVAISCVGYLLFAEIQHEAIFYLSALIIGLGNGHMFPAFQNMFINMVPNDRRGTANSTLLVSWDIGVGIGTLLGGLVAQHYGYHQAFLIAWIVNLAGVALYFLYSRGHYLRHKLV